jgi:hypothetical protein
MKHIKFKILFICNCATSGGYVRCQAMVDGPLQHTNQPRKDYCF